MFAPRRIQYKINTFSPCELCCRDKITVARNKNYLTYKSFVGQGSDIDADTHVYPLLVHIIIYITFR